MLTEYEKLEMVPFWLEKLSGFTYCEKENYVIMNDYGRRIYLGSNEFIALIYPLILYKALDHVNVKYSLCIRFIEFRDGWTWGKIRCSLDMGISYYSTIEEAREHAVRWLYNNYDKLGEEED